MFEHNLLTLGAASFGVIQFLGQTLLAIIVCAAVIAFAILFAGKLGIFARKRVEDWTREFTPRISRSRSTVGKATRTHAQTFTYDPDAKEANAYSSDRNFKVWSKAFPIEKRVYEEFDGLLRSNSPTRFLLLSTDPPTLKMTQWGPMPIVTALYQVEDLDKFPEYYTTLPKNVVATAHNHLKDASIAEHDIEIFESIDRLIGMKVHVIGTKIERRMYCTGDGPVFTGHAAVGGEK